MRIFMAITIALLVSAVPVMAQSVADEAAIREATKQYEDAYNKRDIEAIASLIDENCQSWPGDRKSRADYVKWHEERFARQKNHQRKLSEEIGIDFITPDIAIISFSKRPTAGLVPMVQRRHQVNPCWPTYM